MSLFLRPQPNRSSDKSESTKKRIVVIVFIGFLLLASFCAYCAQNIPLVPWEKLLDKDISPQGKLALSLDKNQWKHAQTEHFVYHFSDIKEAETVYIHAEVYYGWIKELFGIANDQWSKKGHIFVFENKDRWRDFGQKANVGIPGADAFTTGWELFIFRNPFWLTPRKTLAHELTHIILFRFLDGPIPLFLNEGFAEFISYKAIAVQFGGNEYRVHQINLLKASDYIPLETLISMEEYPKDNIGIFYQESELLTRFFLTKYDSKKYYSVLREVSGGAGFSKAVESAYGLSLSELEKKFKDEAILKGK